MIALQPRSDLTRNPYGQSLPSITPGVPPTVQSRMRSHAVQEAPRIVPHLGPRLHDADDAQSLGFAKAYPPPRIAASVWLDDALAALAVVDDEIAEENLPAIDGNRPS